MENLVTHSDWSLVGWEIWYLWSTVDRNFQWTGALISSQFGGKITFFKISQKISQLLQNFSFVNWKDSMTLWDEFCMVTALPSPCGCLKILKDKDFHFTIRSKSLKIQMPLKRTHQKSFTSQSVSIKIILMAITYI